jgi:hypothetical protein
MGGWDPDAFDHARMSIDRAKDGMPKVVANGTNQLFRTFSLTIVPEHVPFVVPCQIKKVWPKNLFIS